MLVAKMGFEIIPLCFHVIKPYFDQVQSFICYSLFVSLKPCSGRDRSFICCINPIFYIATVLYVFTLQNLVLKTGISCVISQYSLFRTSNLCAASQNLPYKTMQSTVCCVTPSSVQRKSLFCKITQSLKDLWC